MVGKGPRTFHCAYVGTVNLNRWTQLIEMWHFQSDVKNATWDHLCFRPRECYMTDLYVWPQVETCHNTQYPCNPACMCYVSHQSCQSNYDNWSNAVPIAVVPFLVLDLLFRGDGVYLYVLMSHEMAEWKTMFEWEFTWENGKTKTHIDLNIYILRSWNGEQTNQWKNKKIDLLTYNGTLSTRLDMLRFKVSSP